ncbi:MAG TPA: glycerate kinase [Acidimicrobiales bacterium]|nr:glycerate kinase [Acidimicrobiales bacterium]
MPHLVAAPDKFRGTASAPEVAAAIASAAEGQGWSADQVPMSDGGEGLLQALGGEPRHTPVHGPLGVSTSAEWRLRDDQDGGPPEAVVEMSCAAGRALVPRPQGDDPLRADTTGVGELLLAARDAGARRIVIGCGGSATTDGGWGAVQAVGSSTALAGIDLVVACDVTTPFRQAAALFGPQKGATPEQVTLLTARLDALAERYRQDFGTDVDALAGSGAAGGLAGGLAALGARIVPGFDLVSAMTGLPGRMVRADLVVTGEGHLDPPSFHGKVPGGVLGLAAGICPVLCVVGDADPAVLDAPPTGMEIISLTGRFGPERARSDTARLVTEVVAEVLPRFCP